MKSHIVFYIAIPLLLLTSCINKVILRPEIEGRVFNSDTKKPEKDVIVEIKLSQQGGGGRTFEESLSSDSLGYYKIEKIERFEPPLLAIESGRAIFCTNCPLVLKKEGYQNDTLLFHHSFIKVDNYTSYTLDSLFFTARPIE